MCSAGVLHVFSVCFSCVQCVTCMCSAYMLHVFSVCFMCSAGVFHVFCVFSSSCIKPVLCAIESMCNFHIFSLCSKGVFSLWS